MPPRPSPLVRLLRLIALTLAVALILRLTARADFLEKIHNAFSLNDPENRFHLQLSGLADLEAYSIDQPAPGLIFPSTTFSLTRA